MEPAKIAEMLREAYPSEVREIREFRGQVSVTVKKGQIKEMMRHLRTSPEFYFDYLQDISAVDYLAKKETRFEVVYHLYSLKHRHSIRIKAEVPDDDCSIDSVISIWRGADWLERECFDMMGIRFNGHPDLRRVLLPEDWEGYPLRKDYQLKSDLGEKEWHGIKEVIETAERNKVYDIR